MCLTFHSRKKHSFHLLQSHDHSSFNLMAGFGGRPGDHFGAPLAPTTVTCAGSSARGFSFRVHLLDYIFRIFICEVEFAVWSIKYVCLCRHMRSVMGDPKTVLEGSVKYRDKKKWKSRWAVVSKLSPVAVMTALVEDIFRSSWSLGVDPTDDSDVHFKVPVTFRGEIDSSTPCLQCFLLACFE
ncbi:hypothetical protein NPIL_316511 [Nephila pilipes]|uniref:Uncharacterized protein n=1 Tax=Nephila pilipes TaxID=299642 RepID=A0A8X6QKG1_NEPPI|nr:hypothetical protein NPIL_316511 [Nephila pilipes]